MVWGIRRKVIVMNFNESTGLTEDVRNGMFAKIPIYKEGQRIRLLLPEVRTGSPHQVRLVRDHNL